VQASPLNLSTVSDSPSATIPSTVVIAMYKFENVTTDETGR
jgi:hypothetical protein